MSTDSELHENDIALRIDKLATEIGSLNPLTNNIIRRKLYSIAEIIRLDIEEMLEKHPSSSICEKNAAYFRWNDPKIKIGSRETRIWNMATAWCLLPIRFSLCMWVPEIDPTNFSIHCKPFWKHFFTSLQASSPLEFLFLCQSSFSGLWLPISPFWTAYDVCVGFYIWIVFFSIVSHAVSESEVKSKIRPHWHEL